MSKVTSKYRVTLPKAIAEQYGIRPGDEIDWVPAGDVIRVIPSRRAIGPAANPESRLRWFDPLAARVAFVNTQYLLWLSEKEPAAGTAALRIRFSNLACHREGGRGTSEGSTANR
jgi:AbrB family looped-hinge helix DNA binding protein